MVISVVSFVTQSWGHYVGTGMWGGAMILMSGLSAVFASRLKSVISIKTFCLCSTAATVSSLAMLILSAGGLTLSSGFYSRLDPPGYSKRTSNLIHASLLVISVFCLSGNILAVIVCCKYLFFEHYNRSKHRHRHRTPLREGASRASNSLRGGGPNTVSLRASTDSRTPLQCSEPSHRRHSDHVDINLVHMEYRRSHRRSASDQQQAPHTRRHRQCPGHTQTRLNVLSPDTVAVARYNVDRRKSRTKVSGHQTSQEMRANSKERDRLNIEPARQVAIPSRQASNHFLHSCIPRNMSSAIPKIRLPTEFDEEELPPYEPMETPQSQNDHHNISTVDSGDESDTENSSSTEAHSYDADASCLDGGNSRAETVRMVDLHRHGNQRDNLLEHTELHTNHEQMTSFISPPLSPPTNSALVSPSVRSQNHEGISASAEDSHSIPLTVNGEEVNLISMSVNTGENTSDLLRPNHCVLRFAVSSHPSDPSGEYERLLAVSPEICAINGESPSPIPTEEHILHEVSENFYENGPCYENCQHVGKALKLNQLSKPSVPSMTNAGSCKEPEVITTSSVMSSVEKASVSTTCTAAVCVLSQSTAQTSVSSPTSFHSNISSSFSAFKPVGASSISSPQNTRVITPQSFPPSDLPDVSSPLVDGAVKVETSSGRLHTPTESSALLSQRYREQGAKPKTVKSKGGHTSSTNDNANLSWKNIPLPFSYNHTDCVSCDSEDKLPSKFIPFTDPLKNTSLSPSSHAHLLSRSPSSNLFQSQADSNGDCTTSFNAVAQSILSPSLQTSRPILENSAASATTLATSQATKKHFSSFREAGTQANSPLPSAQVLSGATGRQSQSLLHHRREEPTRTDLSKEGTPSTKAHQSSGTQTNWKPTLAIGTVALRSTRLGPRFHTSFSSGRNGDKFSLSNEGSNGDAPPRFMQLTREKSGGMNGEASAEGRTRASRPLSFIPLLTNASSPTSCSSPLSVPVQPSSLLIRQNPLIQLYPLQPQQPRLGVQLHQRRQQQHQLQHNIESQQLQHQRQQEQQLQQQQHEQRQPQQNHQDQQQQQQRHSPPLAQDPQQQPPLQGLQPQPRQQPVAVQAVNIQNPNDRQQLRNGRPLFSVLL
ncbi:hypothetical protein ElyMa_001775100 [Elysia marginata]|uniref:Uncharacterized protein n=1 Tax=Elysia marginata TaxID=1093978 RepID=A0AAV4ECD5_9GAST|nr:hypothetical protein ElyMa_001775100 [Elysia marginata]